MLAYRIIAAVSELLAPGKGVLSGIMRELQPPIVHAPLAAMTAAAARPLTLADQWARVTLIIATASARAAETRRCHSAASVQLDLAHYGLTSLVAELATVMDVGVRPMSASVHVLKLGKSHKVEGALAA